MIWYWRLPWARRDAQEETEEVTVTPPYELCGARREWPRSVCALPLGHAGNHRGVFSQGIVQWPPEDSGR